MRTERDGIVFIPEPSMDRYKPYLAIMRTERPQAYQDGVSAVA